MLTQLTGGDLDSISSGVGLTFATGSLGEIVSSLLKILFPIVGLLLLLYLLYGGYQYMLSRGDPKAIEAAKGVITNALVGFVIVFVAFWLVQLIGRVLGIPDIYNLFGGSSGGGGGGGSPRPL